MLNDIFVTNRRAWMNRQQLFIQPEQYAHSNLEGTTLASLY
jgi:hypothetical protein